MPPKYDKTNLIGQVNIIQQRIQGFLNEKQEHSNAAELPDFARPYTISLSLQYDDFSSGPKSSSLDDLYAWYSKVWMTYQFLRDEKLCAATGEIDSDFLQFIQTDLRAQKELFEAAEGLFSKPAIFHELLNDDGTMKSAPPQETVNSLPLDPIKKWFSTNQVRPSAEPSNDMFRWINTQLMDKLAEAKMYLQLKSNMKSTLYDKASKQILTYLSGPQSSKPGDLLEWYCNTYAAHKFCDDAEDITKLKINIDLKKEPLVKYQSNIFTEIDSAVSKAKDLSTFIEALNRNGTLKQTKDVAGQQIENDLPEIAAHFNKCAAHFNTCKTYIDNLRNQARTAASAGVAAENKQDAPQKPAGLFRKYVKALKAASMFTDSSEYRDIIKTAEYLDKVKKLPNTEGMTSKQEEAAKMWVLKNKVDAYIAHKAKDGVKQNTYKKLAAVEALNEHLERSLYGMNIEKFEIGGYNVDPKEIWKKREEAIPSKLGSANNDADMLHSLSIHDAERALADAQKNGYVKYPDRAEKTEFINNQNCMTRIIHTAHIKGLNTAALMAQKRNFIKTPNTTGEKVKEDTRTSSKTV